MTSPLQSPYGGGYQSSGSKVAVIIGIIISIFGICLIVLHTIEILKANSGVGIGIAFLLIGILIIIVGWPRIKYVIYKKWWAK